jgi:hypothetical protein
MKRNSLLTPIGLLNGRLENGKWAFIDLRAIIRSFDFLLFKEPLLLTPSQLEIFLEKRTIPDGASLLFL